MQFNNSATVREIVMGMPNAARVFEKLGIDYCCGGTRPITEACHTAGVTLAEVAQSLEQLEQMEELDGANPASAGSKDWQAESLTALTTHIVNKHHNFTREELDSIEPLLAKVCSVYSERAPELVQIQALFGELKGELLPHMKKEENVLFPYITQMENAIGAGQSLPVPMFGTVRNPVRMMMAEHDNAGDLLRSIRLLSNDFTLPADACVSYQTLYRRLQELEQDLHQHIHLENNILFPRAIEIEG